jgi:hypothetical protein
MEKPDRDHIREEGNAGVARREFPAASTWWTRPMASLRGGNDCCRPECIFVAIGKQLVAGFDGNWRVYYDGIEIMQERSSDL